jgi:hypothetical protein
MTIRQRRLLGFTLVSSLVGVLVILYVLYPPPPPPPRPNTNRLAVGAAANVEALDIPIRAPMDFDGMTRQQVYALRAEAVGQHPELLAVAYRPDEAVFGQIVDGLPWWGLVGQFYHAMGERSIDGASEESRLILNPYLLVAPEFYGMSYYNNADFAWDARVVDEDAVSVPDFPLTCFAGSLRWEPARAYAEVVYRLGACLEAMNRYTANELTLANSDFDLFSYNARDLNLNVMRVAASENIDPPTTPPEAIPYFIHQGNSCQYPGGCNNMSPYMASVSNMEALALPATLDVHLWAAMPAQPDAAPDFTYRIRFE